MPRLDQEQSPYTLIERYRSSLAHLGLLVIGLPLTVVLLPIPFSLAPCPVVAYLIARYFRRRNLVWGAAQGIQASAVQVLIVLIASLTVLTNMPATIDLTMNTAAFLLIGSINGRDLPVITASVFVIALMVMVVNLVVDFLYTWLDPRISYAD